MNIPKDPFILLSYINTKLRDAYPNLEDLCKSMLIPQEFLESTLGSIRYSYDKYSNQFRPIN